MIKDPISLIPFKKEEKYQHNWQLCINGIPQFNEHKHLCGTLYKSPITISREEFEEIKKLQQSKEEYPFTIKNFTYNGFFGKSIGGNALYKAKFKQWTGDPGIALMECSDGKERQIPTYAIVGPLLLPKDQTKKDIIFGEPSKS